MRLSADLCPFCNFESIGKSSYLLLFQEQFYISISEVSPLTKHVPGQMARTIPLLSSIPDHLPECLRSVLVELCIGWPVEKIVDGSTN